MVNFFTVFCQPCRHEMPDLNAIYNENKDKGLAMVGICLNADPNQLKVVDQTVETGLSGFTGNG